MFHTYVLLPETSGELYKGHTDNLHRRLIEHNNNNGKYYTSNKGPWKLLYSEAFETRSEAMKREKFFKSGKGQDFLKQKMEEQSA